jgi:zinc/manganese transport system permease protein
VPVGAIGVGFLVLLAVCAAEATQAVGALLLVGLIAGPGGAAHRLATRPWAGVAIATGIAVGATWLGLVVSYRFGSIPPSFAIIAIVTAVYALSVAVSIGSRRARR